MVVTRFNPSVTGKLHLGHIFTMLVNEYYAHSRDGKFYIRFDDDNLQVHPFTDKEMKETLKSQIEDMEWLEIDIDGDLVYQSDLHPEINRILRELEYEAMPDEKQGYYKIPYFIRMGTTYIPYPYTAQQTAERVIMDSMLGVTHVIRGDDFATEFSLYCYFCQRFSLPTPEFIFLPRLVSTCGDISKTNGGYKISDFRENGYTASQLKRMLAEACLIYPNNGWEIYNIKSNPRINL